MKGLANRPQKCKKSEGDARKSAIWYIHFL